MKLVLLAVDNLPRTVYELRWAPATTHVATVTPAIAAGYPDEHELLEQLAAIPVRPTGVKIARVEPFGERTRREEHFAIHDGFFGVFRASGEAPELFAHAVLVGYRDILREALSYGTTLGPVEWGDLRWGLEEAIRYATGAAPKNPRPLPVPTPAPKAHRDPHRRWRAGHHAFFPLIQSIVVGLSCFKNALLDGAEPAAGDALRFAAATMRASASAMRFAADFVPAEYAGMVRPAMAPPYLPTGLSGVMSEDHERLVRSFRELRELFPLLHGDLRRLRDEFVDVVDNVYEAHKHVCGRFDGDRVVSLRMNRSSSESAVGVLDQLQKARLKLLRTS
jgi:hypothetical protein